MHLAAYLLGLGSALLVGFSKTGLPGVSIPGILLMTEAFADDAKLSLGAILPVLLAGDVFAVLWYRHHAQWNRLLGLFPYVLAGMLPGVVVLLWLEGNELRPVLGWLILGLLAIEVGRQWREHAKRPAAAREVRIATMRMPSFHQPPCPLGPACTCGKCGALPAGEVATATTSVNQDSGVLADHLVATARVETISSAAVGRHVATGLVPEQMVALSLPSASWCFMAGMGLLAGFATMIANAAMPVMTIYLISRRLRKEQFIGTAAWFFFLINLSKLPVCLWVLNVVTPRTLRFGLLVAPMTVVGALVGVYVLARIPQRFFDALALSLAGIAAVRLIVV